MKSKMSFFIKLAIFFICIIQSIAFATETNEEYLFKIDYLVNEENDVKTEFCKSFKQINDDSFLNNLLNKEEKNYTLKTATIILEKDIEIKEKIVVPNWADFDGQNYTIKLLDKFKIKQNDYSALEFNINKNTTISNLKIDNLNEQLSIIPIMISSYEKESRYKVELNNITINKSNWIGISISGFNMDFSFNNIKIDSTDEAFVNINYGKTDKLNEFKNNNIDLLDYENLLCSFLFKEKINSNIEIPKFVVDSIYLELLSNSKESDSYLIGRNEEIIKLNKKIEGLELAYGLYTTKKKEALNSFKGAMEKELFDVVIYNNNFLFEGKGEIYCNELAFNILIKTFREDIFTMQSIINYDKEVYSTLVNELSRNNPIQNIELPNIKINLINDITIGSKEYITYYPTKLEQLIIPSFVSINGNGKTLSFENYKDVESPLLFAGYGTIDISNITLDCKNVNCDYAIIFSTDDEKRKSNVKLNKTKIIGGELATIKIVGSDLNIYNSEISDSSSISAFEYDTYISKENTNIYGKLLINNSKINNSCKIFVLKDNVEKLAKSVEKNIVIENINNNLSGIKLIINEEDGNAYEVMEYEITKIKGNQIKDFLDKKYTWINPFEDVKENSWYYEYVKFVNQNKILNGTSNTRFEPNQKVTRAMLVTALYRMSKNTDIYESTFKDVSKENYYYNAISWAENNKIIFGNKDGNFYPNDNIKREDVATIVYRYLNYMNNNKNIITSKLNFDDSSEIASYAYEAVRDLSYKGIIVGKNNNKFLPKDFATRAEIAKIICECKKKI